MTTATFTHSGAPISGAAEKPNKAGFFEKFVNVLAEGRKAQADRDSVNLLQSFDDKALREFGYSPRDIRSIRSGHLRPVK